MSATAKIPSTRVQNQTLPSDRAPAPLSAFGGEVSSSFEEPIQTRSQAKRKRMKNHSDSPSDSFEEKEAQDFDIGSTSSLSDLCDDDEMVELCRQAEERQEQELQQTQAEPWETIGSQNSIPSLRKRPLPTFYQDWDTPSPKYNKKNNAPTRSTSSKKRKSWSRDTTFTKSNNDDSKAFGDNDKPTSALIHQSPSEIKTTITQQQTDLFSPVSPVPASIANDDISMFTPTSNNRCDKKENDGQTDDNDDGLEQEQEKGDLYEHNQQLSVFLGGEGNDDDDNDESDQLSTSSDEDDDEGNRPRMTTINNGDGEGSPIISQMANHRPLDDQQNQLKESLTPTISQELPSSMECHSDTQSTDVSMRRDDDHELNATNKSDEPSLNLKKEQDIIMDGNVRPVGFLKRVASYIFG
ncbi:hypothetical protein BCR42DRAFT_456845 [Absidia repens]|uniref:Uncharacterized protein n=1 Tax=Absidia repens TaxID=90262 RepID=A0A1X2HYU1_9FUNG|nr:hypothetical protein BCR42DRAFT_456845 [Absidia repens]